MLDNEKIIMEQTFKAAMLRAADIIDRITQDDVAEAHMVMYASGVSLDKLAKIDRAMIGACHLRACAQMGSKAQATAADVAKSLEKNHV